MIDLSYDFIITLQNEVLRQFGVDNLQPNQCKHLAQAILNHTGKLVSETTLKRVFGFAVTQHSFSRYTLNTLAQYCRFKDWEEFQTHYYKKTLRPSAQTTDHSRWADVKKRAAAVSHYTLLTLKNRCGVPFDHTVPRQYCLSHIERFLESDYAATVFIAPAGWGKSMALVHAAEHFWFGRDPVYQQDICWFINAHAAGSLLVKGFSLSAWLDNQLNLGNGENFREYFSANAHEKGGRLILIIDGFDELAMGADKLKMLYNKLEDFVYSNDQHTWVKVILSIRSSTWGEVFQQSTQYPAFRKYWYLGPEMDEETNTNIPLLTEQEVKSVLYNCEYEPATVRLFSENFLQKLRHPYYLQLFCQLSSTPDQSFVDENLSLYEIISRFIQNRVFNSPNNAFKIKIIEKLLVLLDMGRDGLYTDKSKLLNQNADLFPAYKELIADNILVEENLSQEIMFNVKIRFAHNFLLEYFTAMHFIQQHGSEVSEEMVQTVMDYFPQSPFRISVFKWLMRYAINNDQVAGIQYIFQQPLSTMGKAHLLEYVVLHYQQEGNHQPQLSRIFPPGYFRKNPISNFISDDFIHFKKRKMLNTLLGMAESPEDKLKIRCNLFVMALMQLDAEQCEIELANIKKLCMADDTVMAMWINPYEAFLFIYEYLKFGIMNEAARDKIYHYAQCWSFPERQPFTVSEEAVYRAICFTFLLLGDPQQLLNFTQRLFKEHPSILYNRTDPFRLMMLCWKAQAHLDTGDIASAKRINIHVERILKYYATDFFNGRHLETLQKIIAAGIYYKENDFNKAIRAAESAMDTAQKLDFKIFALLNYGVLNRIYQHLQMDKQKKDALQKIESIRESTSFKQALPHFL
ncbi:hypothetical protein GFS24_16535 [Chitinophaga sp. SYP-B3965]|uniref:NACHT domain-containing protein n=1 Tax=Chitinophaga sp. SYP-B3965 TaxID=2663120 RepID=UPI0012999EB4|nr:hypothetical protein [Chitinophaga sp. SYP-B3965]MRG46729.1 hypothetical protein [Chitinophaga sp. SYP-B3965]